ncbi:MAG: hypothetical protein WC346_12750 [Methanogenium sp.]|jgi:hypothetical protein
MINEIEITGFQLCIAEKKYHVLFVTLSNGKKTSLTIVPLSSFLVWASPEDLIDVGKVCKP